MDRLEAIGKSLKLVPPEFEMVAFLAHAKGFKRAADRAEQKPAAQEQTHPGGAVVLMFPDGNIRVG